MNELPSVPPEWIDPGALDRAAAVQRDMAARVRTSGAMPRPPRRIAGADVSHRPRDPDALVHAAIVALDSETLDVTERSGATLPPRFPYVPGFLGFREIPALAEAFRRLPGGVPDLIFVDGHGVSHPRGLGVAAHLGVLLDAPTIGVAKSILVGRPEGELAPEAGSRTALVWKGRTIGAVVRTKRRVNPVYISVGHRISLDDAVRMALLATRGYRLPEPTRQAHLAANAWRLAAEETAR